MLTYDDCVGLCGLAAAEIDAIARQEHLPGIIALEMGACLSAMPEGRLAVRRIVLEDLHHARRRGDTALAAELQRVLRHVAEACLGRSSPAKIQPQADGAVRATSAPPAEPLDEDDDYAMRALGLDSSTAPWVRARVDSCLTAMLRHFGLDHRQVQERFRSELQAARTCCAACTETARCRRFLAESTGSEPPSAFCPNAPLLGELLRRSLHPRPAA
jgi:hypothetical protein